MMKFFIENRQKKRQSNDIRKEDEQLIEFLNVLRFENRFKNQIESKPISFQKREYIESIS